MNFLKLPKTFIIAEIGNNHEGNFNNAVKLIEKASYAGVDAVKFQTFKTEMFVSINEKKRFKQLKKFEFTYDQFLKLSKIAKNLNLKFISTPLDIESAIFLRKIVDIYKIASADNNYFDLIHETIKQKKPIIISTGFSKFSEVKKICNFLRKKSVKRSSACLLHCVGSYPVKKNEANLLSIKFLQKNLYYPVGYSDHTIGLEASYAASIIGAKVIEKHFTLSNNFSKFRDHKLSLNPENMKKLVENIRSFEEMKGKENKILQPGEKLNLKLVRRSPYAFQNISKKDYLNNKNVIFLRPSHKITFQKWSNLKKKIAKKNIKKNSQIKISDILKR